MLIILRAGQRITVAEADLGEVLDMTANDIMYRIRLYVGDTDKKSLSDWEVLSSVNDALRLMAEESARLGGSMFRMKSNVTITAGSASLPTGYLQVIKAFNGTGGELLNVSTDIPDDGEFSITGGSLSSGEATVELWYFGYPAAVVSADSTINLPESMAVPLARVASLLLANKIGDAVLMADYFSGGKMDKSERKE